MIYYIHLINNIENDPRPKRFAEYLISIGKQIKVVEYKNGSRTRIDRLLQFSKFLLGINRNDSIEKFLNFTEKEKNSEFNREAIHIFEDSILLPHFFVSYKEDKSLVIVDVRDYYPLAKNDIKFNLTYKIVYNYVISNFLDKVDKIITVSKAHRDLLLKKHKLKSEVVLSLPKKTLNKFTQTKDEKIQFVYLGLANKYRGIELACEVFVRFKIPHDLNLYLTGDRKYVEKLKMKYANSVNIHFYSLNEHSDVESTLLQNHVGLAIFNKPWNVFNSLPNKFFNYINTHNMVIVLAKSEMSKYVKEYKNGIILQEFTIECLGDSIQKLSLYEVNSFREASYLASYSLCQEAQSDQLKRILFV